MLEPIKNLLESMDHSSDSFHTERCYIPEVNKNSHTTISRVQLQTGGRLLNRFLLDVMTKKITMYSSEFGDSVRAIITERRGWFRYASGVIPERFVRCRYCSGNPVVYEGHGSAQHRFVECPFREPTEADVVKTVLHAIELDADEESCLQEWMWGFTVKSGLFRNIWAMQGKYHLKSVPRILAGVQYYNDTTKLIVMVPHLFLTAEQLAKKPLMTRSSEFEEVRKPETTQQDMISQMAQTLSNLPRVQAYAKILTEGEGWKGHIQTLAYNKEQRSTLEEARAKTRLICQSAKILKKTYRQGKRAVEGRRQVGKKSRCEANRRREGFRFRNKGNAKARLRNLSIYVIKE